MCVYIYILRIIHYYIISRIFYDTLNNSFRVLFQTEEINIYRSDRYINRHIDMKR